MSVNPFILNTYTNTLPSRLRSFAARFIPRVFHFCMGIVFLALFCASVAEAFQISEGFPEEQKAILLKDISILNQIQFEVQNKWLLKIFEAEKFDQSKLIQWINERVRYLIPDNYFDNHWARIQDTSYAYQNPGIYPEYALHWIFGMNRIDAKKMLLSQNTGVDLYIQGKSAGKVILLQNPLGEIEQIKSPRVGLVQLGPLFFRNPLEKFKMPSNSQNRIAYSLFRIAALAHEGRHSDGNSHSLGFLHAKCPEGHDLAGLLSCDINLNGPYQIEGLLLMELINTCTSCMDKEKEILRLSALDDLSRVIKKTRVTIPAERKKECDALREQQKKTGNPSRLPADCFDFAFTGYWDAAPEGDY